MPPHFPLVTTRRIVGFQFEALLLEPVGKISVTIVAGIQIPTTEPQQLHLFINRSDVSKQTGNVFSDVEVHGTQKTSAEFSDPRKPFRVTQPDHKRLSATHG